MLQSSLHSIFSYSMQNTRLPIRLLVQLDKIGRRFILGEFHDQRSLHTIAWHKVYQPREKDGLGLPLLDDVNKVALARICWDILMKENRCG